MKLKKLNSKGFVLAETLVVAVFLMAIFTLIFTNYYPLMGEYEKRETYDDVDGKYAIYWIKRMIEDTSYSIPTGAENFFKDNGYIRFECKNVSTDNEKQTMCRNLVKALEVKGCNSEGNHCEIYITTYRIGEVNNPKMFKNVLKSTDKGKIKRYAVNGDNKNNYLADCKKGITSANAEEICQEDTNRDEFRRGFKDYVESLPDYSVESLNGSGYRVIACFQHKKDNNNYYSYSTIEVDR